MFFFANHLLHPFFCQLHASNSLRGSAVYSQSQQAFVEAYISTKCDHATLFENALVEYGIEYQRIRIGTPQHNDKVERQHRLDEMRFYKHMRMFSLEDGRKQLARYQRLFNNIIMTCLNMRSPNQVLELYRDIV